MCSYSQSLDFAYPPPDTDIRDYLDTPRPTFDEYQACYLLLLGHIFQAVSAELGRICVHKQPTYAALAHEWRMHLDNAENRSRIYKEAEKGCRNDMLVRPLCPVSHSSLTVLVRRIHHICTRTQR